MAGDIPLLGWRLSRTHARHSPYPCVGSSCARRRPRCVGGTPRFPHEGECHAHGPGIKRRRGEAGPSYRPGQLTPDPGGVGLGCSPRLSSRRLVGRCTPRAVLSPAVLLPGARLRVVLASAVPSGARLLVVLASAGTGRCTLLAVLASVGAGRCTPLGRACVSRSWQVHTASGTEFGWCLRQLRRQVHASAFRRR